MRSKLLGLSIITAITATMSVTAFAEPKVQPGESLESLSKVKMSTTVNGQAASLQELVASGQIRIISSNQGSNAAPMQENAQLMDSEQPHATSDGTAPAQAVPHANMSNASPDMPMADTTKEN